MKKRKGKRAESADKGYYFVEAVINDLNSQLAHAEKPLHFEMRNRHKTSLNVNELTQLNRVKNRLEQMPNSRGVGYDSFCRGYDDVKGGVRYYFKPSDDEAFLKGPTPEGGYTDGDRFRIAYYQQYLELLAKLDIYVIFFEKDKQRKLTRHYSKAYSLTEILGNIEYNKDWKLRFNRSNLNRIVLLNIKPNELHYMQPTKIEPRSFFLKSLCLLDQLQQIYNTKFKINETKQDRSTKSLRNSKTRIGK